MKDATLDSFEKSVNRLGAVQKEIADKELELFEGEDLLPFVDPQSRVFVTNEFAP